MAFECLHRGPYVAPFARAKDLAMLRDDGRKRFTLMLMEARPSAGMDVEVSDRAQEARAICGFVERVMKTPVQATKQFGVGRAARIVDSSPRCGQSCRVELRHGEPERERLWGIRIS